jgi:hypothetical protein
MLGIVTVCVKTEAMTKTCGAAEMFLGHTLEKGNQPAVDGFLFLKDLREGKVLFGGCHACVKSVDASVFFGILRQFAALKQKRQVL